MILFFIITILILLAVIIFQYKTSVNQKNSLAYIHQKLKRIIDGKTDERLLLHTSEESLKQILIEINRLLEQNQKIKAEYNRSEMSMRKMLSNISHDLKTPLTVVLGYVEMLLHDPGMPKEELQKVHGKTLEVLALIRKFFDLAKLESGDKDISLTRVNLNEICRTKILDYYEILSSRSFEVEIMIPENIVYVLANEDELNRILDNLISNAIQYGGDGKVLGLNLRSDEQHVYVDVWDRGKGISEPHQDFVFERMYTLEDSRNKLYQGSGLGLTITKRLVEKMGGEIQLVSKPFEKTIFTITLKRMKF